MKTKRVSGRLSWTKHERMEGGTSPKSIKLWKKGGRISCKEKECNGVLRDERKKKGRRRKRGDEALGSDLHVRKQKEEKLNEEELGGTDRHKRGRK